MHGGLTRTLLLFVDVISGAGRYQASRHTVEVSTINLDNGRLFHVEREQYLALGRLADQGVEELDTIVVVHSCDPLSGDPSVIGALWRVTGGQDRRERRRPSSTRSLV